MDTESGEEGRSAKRLLAGGIDPWAHLWAVATVVVATIVAWLMFPWFDLADLIMVYLLGIVVVAMRYGRAASLLASFLSVGAVNFFFVPPYFTFAVAHSRYAITFLVMFVVAVAIGGLTVRMRAQAAAARQRERHTAALYAMSRDLASTRGVDGIVELATRHVGDLFESTVVVLFPDTSGQLVTPPVRLPGRVELRVDDLARAQEVYQHRQATGLGTDVRPRDAALYLPLLASRGPVGVIRVQPADRHAFDGTDERHQLETFANQIALAIERARLAEEAEEARVRMETERLRNALLSSVSHDLRTPLATITGAASTVLDTGDRLDARTRQELLESVRDEAERLGLLVQNLLQMTRIESGALELRKEWHSMEEVIGAALGRVENHLAKRRVHTRVPPDLPLVPMDDVLIEQVLVNLVENAVKYTPADSPIFVTATATDQAVSVEVADRGPGLPVGEEDRIFAKFYRVGASPGRGSGLGLAICEGIVRAHGGRIWAHRLPEGGSAFFFNLPLGGRPPAVIRDE